MTLPLYSAAKAAWRAAYFQKPDARPLPDPHPAAVKLSIKAVPDARTADTLGAEREGTGILIEDSGLIITIGYLMLEAGSVLAITHDGRVFSATPVGFDHPTGFGLVRVSAPLGIDPVELGDSACVEEYERVSIAAHAGAGGTSFAYVVSRRRFTGYWEYMVEDAVFTAPPRFEHSGAGLLDAEGRLVGIGSLWVGDVMDRSVAFPGNMFVPINLVKPLMRDLIATGRRRGPARPWLGIYTEEISGHLVVTRTLTDGPAHRAGLKRGDIILGVGGEPIGSQSDFYRKLWGAGEAGVELKLHVLHKKEVREVSVRSADRMDYLRPAATY